MDEKFREVRLTLEGVEAEVDDESGSDDTPPIEVSSVGAGGVTQPDELEISDLGLGVASSQETPMDTQRRYIAFAMIGLFGLSIIGYYIGVFTDWASAEELNPVQMAIGPLVGAVVGFYFGEKRGLEPAAQRTLTSPHP